MEKLLQHLPRCSTSAGGYHANDPLALSGSWEDDSVPPVINKDEIRFNGAGKSSHGEDLGHETFILTRKQREREDWESKFSEGTFNFCKTARKPYDLVVCAVLIVGWKHAPEAFGKISSDGDADDWQPALDWIFQVLGEGYAIPTHILNDA